MLQIQIFRFASPVGEVPRRGGGVLLNPHKCWHLHPSVASRQLPYEGSLVCDKLEFGWRFYDVSNLSICF